jgi:hypothetical protein
MVKSKFNLKKREGKTMAKTKIFIPASQESIDAINKNDDERGKREAAQHLAHVANTEPYVAYQKIKPEVKK